MGNGAHSEGSALTRVCHVCSAHPVDDGRVFHRACVSLARAGYEVHLIATAPGEKPYVQNGVTVHPLPKCASQRERFRRRGRVAQMAVEIQPDLFHVHEPELLASVVARAGKRPVVYDVHESYLDVLAEREWLPDRLRPLAAFTWDHMERWNVRRCAAIVTVTEAIAARYRRFHNNVRLICNYPDVVVDDSPPPDRDGRTCVIAGALAPIRGMSELLQALGMLHQRGLEVPLVMAGVLRSDEFLASLLKEAEELGIGGQVKYLGILPRAEAVALQRNASIGLVTYLPTGNNVASFPNKLPELMALGLPVIYSNFPNYHAVADGAGISVDPTRPDQIAAAIERLVRDPAEARRFGEAGKRAVREQFNWNLEFQKLLALYQDVLGSVPHPAGAAQTAEVR